MAKYGVPYPQNNTTLAHPNHLHYSGNWQTIGTTTDTTFTLEGSTVIPTEELEELKADSKLLWALINAGVEEWEGYDEAILNL